MFIKKYIVSIKNNRFYTTFQSLGIPKHTITNLKTCFGIDQPTLSQAQFIPPIIAGKDVILRDTTGTGKSFGIALALTSEHHRRQPSLYITPNQELAHQINYWLQQLNNNDKNPSNIIVDTPAHLLEQFNHCGPTSFSLKDIQCIVIDEVDQALRLPKRHAPLKQQKMRQLHPKPTQLLLNAILSHHQQQSKNKGILKPQIIVSSATLNRPLRYWLQQEGWVKDPIFIDITRGHQIPSSSSIENATNTTTISSLPVNHYCLLLDEDSIRNIKSPSLINEKEGEELESSNNNNNNNDQKSLNFDDTDDRMIDSISILHQVEQPWMKNSILFVDNSISIKNIQQQLASYNIIAKDIREAVTDRRHYHHSSKEKENESERKNTFWIATEFTARGIDLPNISHVFILGNPSSIASYLHMAGRTGRLGQHHHRNGCGGKVISLIRDHGKSEAKMLNMYKLMNINVKPLEHVE
ncbi:P-loop containing nucleoside triphosphate hydrolase protein [Cunninghamella echinulata]|nr:P-loop containing nucleoside triphosphate hydrolase protein [Cunninghamella echinulata]